MAFPPPRDRGRGGAAGAAAWGPSAAALPPGSRRPPAAREARPRGRARRRLGADWGGSVSRLDLQEYLELQGLEDVDGGDPAELEGFDDDFAEVKQLTPKKKGESPEKAEEPEEHEKSSGGPDLFEQLQEARERRVELEKENQLLVLKLNYHVSKQKSDLRPIDPNAIVDEETRYLDSKEHWLDQLKARDDLEAEYAERIAEMKQEVEDAMDTANSIRDTYQKFKAEVARTAENSRTSKLIPQRLINELEAAEQKKEAEVEKIRIKNIQLKNSLSKLELQLQRKEELAEGLHLIDFEQLKIENQSLSEKIEERNEELLKLRKKTTTTVQVLNHLKEKLQFVRKESMQLSKTLEQLELELSQQRDVLARAKQQRDALRQENGKLRQQGGLVTDPLLLNDLEEHQTLRDDLLVECGKLKAQYEAFG